MQSEYEEPLQESQRREARLKKFQEAARAIGEEIERQGLTEEDMLAQLEETREHVYQKRYETLNGTE
jgi:hypothetical protein